VWIEVGILYAKIIRATDEELDWARSYLTFPDARAKFRGGDGKIRLLGMDGRFPAGLVSLVRAAAPKVDKEKPAFKVDLAERREHAPHDPAADLDWLRDYQLDAILACLRARRGLVWLPTASGKGELVVALTRAVPTAEWLFVVHNVSLVEQTAGRLRLRDREHGVDFEQPGIIAEGNWSESRVTFATFQSLSQRLKQGDRRTLALLGRVGGLIVDEAHTCAADTFWAVAMATPRAAYRIGLSGTPLARGDRKSALVIAALGPVIYRQKAEPLIQAGVLSRPSIRMVRVVQSTKRPTWQGVYGDLVVRGSRRNAALVAMAKAAEKPGFLFVKEVSHGRALTKALINAGVAAKFVWGSHSTDARRTALRDLEAGRLDVIVCSVVFQEGIDVPGLRSVVVGAAGRSVIAAIQRVGRGMRIERDRAGVVIKDTFEVYDIDDRGQVWLERAARERRNAYLREGYAVYEWEPPVGQ
jgi:superfamily II DNA or RNA helicase